MELNEQTQKAFGVVSKEEAEEINRERSLFDKIFNPIESRVVSDDVKNLFLDPEVNLADLVATKRPEGISAFDVFSSDPKKRELALYGESKADRRDLLALKSDIDFVEEFANAQNERAALKRKESENSFRNTGYDFLTERLNLDPSTAQGVVTAAEFVPFLGDLPMIEDAVDQFKRGDIKEGALTTLLATAGIAFDGIPLIVDGIKKASKPPQIFVGEKSEFADKVASKKIMESRELTSSADDSFGVDALAEFPNELKSKVYNDEAYIADFGPNKGKLVERVPETDLNPDGESVIPLRTSAERLQDSKNIFRKFYRDNRIMHSGDIITDLKKMPEEQREKTKEMLREIWLKNGWTVGKNNKFYTEVDDSYLFGGSMAGLSISPKTINKNFKFKLFLNEQKQDLINGGVTLPRPLKDVLAHPKLYKAYPQLKNLAIRVMTKDDSDVFDRIGGHYSYGGRDGVSEIVMKVGGFEDKDFDVKRVKKLSESDTFTKKFMSTLIHELQHAVQHIEGVNYSSIRSLNKDKVDKAKLFLDKVIPKHLKDFEEADLKLKSLNPKDYDPKDNYSPYKMAEREREDAKKVLQSRGYKLDELNNLDLQDRFSDVNYYDTILEVEARLPEKRLYYPMDIRAEVAPFDEMTTQSQGISGLDILRKASSDKNGRVDFDKFHKLRTKVLEPIFKQQEEGEKLLDEAFENLTGIKLDIKVPDRYEDWLTGDLSFKTQRDKYVNELNKNLSFAYFAPTGPRAVHKDSAKEALKILDLKLDNITSKVFQNANKVRDSFLHDKSPYVLMKFSDENRPPDSGYLSRSNAGELVDKKLQKDFSKKQVYNLLPEDSAETKWITNTTKSKAISVPKNKIKFKSEKYDGEYTDYFFIREKDLVYNTLYRKRKPTDYKTNKGEIQSLSFDKEMELIKIFEQMENFPLSDIQPPKVIKRVPNTDDNVTFNFYDSLRGDNNNFSTNPILRTLLKRQSTSGPSGVNKFNRINLTNKKMMPRIRKRSFRENEKIIPLYEDGYNKSLNEWKNDMIMRREELSLEQMKDYDYDMIDPQMAISEYNKGQATLEEIFPQKKGYVYPTGPTFLPDDFNYYDSNARKIRRK